MVKILIYPPWPGSDTAATNSPGFNSQELDHGLSLWEMKLKPLLMFMGFAENGAYCSDLLVFFLPLSLKGVTSLGI